MPCDQSTDKPFRGKDLTGRRFGKLVVVGLAQRGQRVRWRCLCDCGRETVVARNHLPNGRIRSCGCLKVTHRKTGTVEHRTWAGMIQRCCNPCSPSYARYGGRGITVCDRWRHSFEDFLADMGERPPWATSIDRINNDAGYGPGNCRWATGVQQCNNRGNNRVIVCRGETRTLAEWARLKGMRWEALHRRLQAGWAVEEALDTPLGPARYREKKFLEYKGETCRLGEWARRKGLEHGLLSQRLRAGWSVEKALETPVAPRTPRKGKAGD